ncbi:MAG: hypothetical protein AB6733_08280 [Clostridiaceae bacterium]
MYPWSILNIDPTEDTSVIKKAYAKKLKIHHPEDDPKGYQNLRQAYDDALKYAKKAVNKFSTGEKAEYESTVRTLLHMELLDNKTQNLPSINDDNAEFMVKVETLYNDFFSRINIENWKDILNSDVMWNIQNKRTISRLMLDFLSCHHYLPKDIWIILDTNFNWCNKENSIRPHYKYDFIMYIEKQIKNSRSSSYCFFRPLDGIDYEKFLEYREKAQDSFNENNLITANLYIKRAKEIYKDDPDLLCLEGKISLRNGKFDDAISAFNKTISINPNDFEAICHRATAYYEKHKIQEALVDYTKFYSKVPEKNEIPLLMAKDYFKIGDLEKSKDWALKAQKIKSTRYEADALLSQLYARLRSRLTKELEKDPSNKYLKLRLDEVNSQVFKNSKKNKNKGSNNIKIHSKTIINFLKLLAELIKCGFLILICLAFIFGTHFGVLILIYLLFKYLKGKEK